MLSGRRPFSGDSSVSVAIAHINQAPPQIGGSVSARTRELIGISLRKDPERRFADGNELALAVHTVRMGERPPQPRSDAMDRRAPAPTPTESTRILGQVTNPTTVQPAVGTTPPPVPVRPVVHRQPPAPRSAPVAPPRRGGGGLIAFLVVLLLGALAAVGWLLISTGTLNLDGLSDRTQPSSPAITRSPDPEPTVVTEIVTTVVPAPEPSPKPSPKPSTTPTTTSEPAPPSSTQKTTRETTPPAPDRTEAPAPSAENVGERMVSGATEAAGTVSGVAAPSRPTTDTRSPGEETP